MSLDFRLDRPYLSKAHIAEKCRELGIRALATTVAPFTAKIYVSAPHKKLDQFTRWVESLTPVGHVVEIVRVSLLRFLLLTVVDRCRKLW